MIISGLITLVDILLAFILVKFVNKNDFPIHKFAGYFFASLIPLVNIIFFFILVKKIFQGYFLNLKNKFKK